MLVRAGITMSSGTTPVNYGLNVPLYKRHTGDTFHGAQTSMKCFTVTLLLSALRSDTLYLHIICVVIANLYLTLLSKLRN
jgi:hypothetical protein